MGRPINDQQVEFVGLAQRTIDCREFFNRYLGLELRGVAPQQAGNRRLADAAFLGNQGSRTSRRSEVAPENWTGS
jgi:hypothetical protein